MWRRRNVGFLVLFAFASFTVVFGKAHLWIRFFRFDNPGGKGDNGHCCDGRVFFCPSKCDHRFVICVDQSYGRRDTSTCPYGVKRTGEITDQDSIVFGGRIGGVRNPMIFDLDSWPGAVRVKIGVWDEDDNNDDKVDFLVQDINSRPARGIASAYRQRFSVRSRVTLLMDVMVYCSPGWYGKACNVKCTPTENSQAGYRCDPNTGRKVCLEGWTGANCDVSEDDCVTNKCRHGATCVDGHRSYTCVCAPGYTGQFCDKEIEECLSSPCQNNGVCTDDVNRFTCTCSPKWTGVTCQVRDACKEVTCSNGGTCFNVNGTFACKCPLGYAGQTCEIDVDECQSFPCRNGATCLEEVGGFRCVCSPGWEGLLCEVDVNECASGPCSRNALECQNLRNDFACVCSNGYTGQKCDVDIDECLKQPCQNGGTCLNREPGFMCSCPFGYYGDTCGEDVDECEASPCAAGATCVNSPGSFHCLCAPDFTGPTCDRQIDDCEGQLCEHNGTCLDAVNDFRCVCTPQYTGRKCGVYVDRCLAEPCQNGAQCFDPGYGKLLQCRCLQGWTGPLCSVDEDECQLDPCANEAECVNTPGSFNCTCPDGWTGLLCQEDINECQLHLKKNQTLSNEPTTVYTTTSNLLPSEDSARAWCQHAGLCVNAGGGFMCICQEGWQGVRCQDDVDECTLEHSVGGGGGADGADGSGPPLCRHGGQCNNTDGGFFCICPAAWVGENCEEDLDECQYFPCSGNASCVNTAGSYHCVCPNGWTGNNCQEDVDECQRGRPAPGSNNTNSISGSIHVTPCPTASDDSNCTVEIVDLSPGEEPPSPCNNGAACRNAPGSFWCVCDSGWTGVTCEEDVNECVVGFSGPAPFDDDGDDDNPFYWTEDRFSPDTEAGDPPGLTGVAVSRADPKKKKKGPGGGKPSYRTGNAPDATGNEPRATTGNAPNAAGNAPDAAGNGPDAPGNAPNATGNAPDAAENAPDATGNAPDATGNASGATGNAPLPTGSSPACLHGGTCRNSPAGSFSCACPPEWTGPRCEEDVDECHRRRPNPCRNAGRCLNTPGGFRCECDDLWEGALCSEEKDLCREVPCENNATCIRRSAAQGGQVQCVCRRGWQGLRCLQDRNECHLDPCLNGGTCLNEMGDFRCLCPGGVAGRTCSNGSLYDEGVTFPLYLEGHFGPEEEIKVKNGVKIFLEQNGGFRHDFSVVAYLNAHALTEGETKTPVTEVYVTVLVENVTLSADDVTEVFNRVPVRDLESYFPLPFFREEMAEHVAVRPSRQQQLDHSPAWYTVVGGMFGMLIIILAVVAVCRKKYTFRWWPQKRSDATVIFSQNGNNNHHDNNSTSSSSAFDDSGMTTQGQGQGAVAEYINTLPYNHDHHDRFNNTDTPPRGTAAWDSIGGGGIFPWSSCLQDTDGDLFARGTAAETVSPGTVTTTPTTQDRPQSAPGPCSSFKSPQVRDPLLLQGEFPEARPRPKTEAVARSRCPKEIRLRGNPLGTLSGEEEEEEADKGEEKEGGRAESCLSASAFGEEEEGSRCFINAIYMTIPVNAEFAAGGAQGGACGNGSGSSYHQFHSFPPDPNRGALPPPPPAAADESGLGGGGSGGAFPSYDIISSDY